SEKSTAQSRPVEQSASIFPHGRPALATGSRSFSHGPDSPWRIRELSIGLRASLRRNCDSENPSSLLNLASKNMRRHLYSLKPSRLNTLSRTFPRTSLSPPRQNGLRAR